MCSPEARPTLHQDPPAPPGMEKVIGQSWTPQQQINALSKVLYFSQKELKFCSIKCKNLNKYENGDSKNV